MAATRVRVEFAPLRLADVWSFEKMRPADAAEVMASGGYSPIEAVVQSWADSKEAWCARFNGEVGAAFGISVHPCGTELTPIAVAWLLTTDVVDRYPISFVRHSRNLLRLFSMKYGMMINYVDARHGKALNWARRIGFHVHPWIPFGSEQRPFHPITYGG